MQATYKMIGADGAEYGPVALTDFQGWVREGRVDGMTHVLRSDQEGWTTAASLPELGVRDRIDGAAATPDSAPADLADAANLEPRIKSGGSWFYWIAALTLINSVSAFCGGEWGFYLGFAAIQALDFAVTETSMLVRGIVLSFDLFVAIGFGALGVFAHRKHTWAFVVGAVFYGLDSLLTLLAVFFGGSIIGLALHAWALVSLILGAKAAFQWRKSVISKMTDD